MSERYEMAVAMFYLRSDELAPYLTLFAKTWMLIRWPDPTTRYHLTTAHASR